MMKDEEKAALQEELERVQAERDAALGFLNSAQLEEFFELMGHLQESDELPSWKAVIIEVVKNLGL